MDITLIGGHSEVTYGIDRPLVMGTMLGEVDRDKLVRTGGAQEGDSIVITKGVAVEGTAVLAREFGSRLLESGMPQPSLEKAREYLYRPGISVVQEARIACSVAEVHSMHDPTEGGVVTGLREIAHGFGYGIGSGAKQHTRTYPMRGNLPALQPGPPGPSGFGLFDNCPAFSPGSHVVEGSGRKPVLTPGKLDR